MMVVRSVVDRLKPAMLMVVAQIGGVGLNVLYKLAVDDGMNLRVLIAYRFIFATGFISPLALIVGRNKRPKMTWTVLFQAFLCGLFGGILAQNLYLEALALASATFASAMANLLPAITFILAVSFRLERLNLRTAPGKAKIVGTIMGIIGAMIITFFKGIEIHTGSFHIALLHHHNGHVVSPQTSSSGNALLGALYALGSCFTSALSSIVQTKLSKSYPCHYSSTALLCFMASLLSTAFALCVERDWTQWKLGSNVRLLTVAYSGIVNSGVMMVAATWCMHMRGPLYVCAFNPLLLVFVVICGLFMLNEKLHLGSIMGGMSIVCGLYVFLWGKDKEIKKMSQQHVSSESLLDDGTKVRSHAEDKHSSDHNNNCDVEIVRVRDHSSENASEAVVRN
ncbi:WAT1-related protein At1g25270-like [Prosopis cineraria]|uniref:WAT1-related protein At1g25270-like n=1 Tax=Prosopis cineraria TaxID=364024 RepID=UPI0024105AAF|nr:WAT1-related protein At1g25270-like [Prosopis cineraria]